jgi:Glycosyltransferase family 87
MIRAFWAAVAVVAAFYLLRHAGFILGGGTRGDLDIIILAAKRFMAHEPVYLLSDPSEHTKPPLLMGIAFPLAFLPEGPVRFFWDLVNLALPFLILRAGLDLVGWQFRWRPWALAWALMYPFWFREAGYGQYNLFILWLVILGSRWLQGERRWLYLAAGALAALTLVIKPTQLYLMPWLALAALGLPKARLRLGLGVLGGVLMGALLAGSYCGLRSWAELIADHREWFQFIPLSAAKHLLGTDNYGLPTLLTRLGWGEWVAGKSFLPVTLAVAGAAAWGLRRRRLESLEVAVLLMLAFSPMCWKANFGLLLTVAYGLSMRLEAELRDWAAWLGILLILVVSKASEYWMGVEFMREFGRLAGPLWLMAGAVGLLAWLRRQARDFHAVLGNVR